MADLTVFSHGFSPVKSVCVSVSPSPSGIKIVSIFLS